MIFVDSNIPMYLIGAEHPHKRDALVLLERLVGERRRLVTNAEVLQEILHRYTAMRRKDAIQPAFDALYGFIDEVYPITEGDGLGAKEVLLGYPDCGARDALHMAHMKRLKITIIFSFDVGFDRWSGIRRIPSIGE
ncbi:MAG: type II toxin-antitoxin system VapC family toxin [Deltaproteobacteria bacterium]|nr:type II toxin-antitoxin system VapC family toxin [Deltaproteobacteria bacterium]